jgi:hypothetical protein
MQQRRRAIAIGSSNTQRLKLQRLKLITNTTRGLCTQSATREQSP